MAWAVGILSGMLIASTPGLCLISVETVLEVPILLSSIGIDVTSRTSLAFSITTCSSGIILVSDTNRTRNHSVTLSMPIPELDARLAVLVCNDQCETDTVKVTMTNLEHCSSPLHLWVSWEDETLMFGEGSDTEKMALKGLPMTYSVAHVIIGSKEKATWAFDYEPIPTTDGFAVGNTSGTDTGTGSIGLGPIQKSSAPDTSSALGCICMFICACVKFKIMV